MGLLNYHDNIKLYKIPPNNDIGIYVQLNTTTLSLWFLYWLCTLGAGWQIKDNYISKTSVVLPNINVCIEED